MRNITDGVKRSELILDDISEDLINESLYTKHSPDPDLLIRTSGEIRFSDFLLWQVSENKTKHLKSVLFQFNNFNVIIILDFNFLHLFFG